MSAAITPRSLPGLAPNLITNLKSSSIVVVSVPTLSRGSNIIFTPTPDANTEIRVWFVPTAQQFSSSTPATSTTTYDDFNGYAEYVVIDAAIKCLQKEESDVSVLLAQKAAMKRRIEEAANNRDAGHPLTVSDVYLENNEFFFGRSTI